MMHRPLGINLRGIDARAGRVSVLSAGEDVEVVVGCVAAGVAFGSQGCAEDDEVFSQA